MGVAGDSRGRGRGPRSGADLAGTSFQLEPAGTARGPDRAGGDRRLQRDPAAPGRALRRRSAAGTDRAGLPRSGTGDRGRPGADLGRRGVPRSPHVARRQPFEPRRLGLGAVAGVGVSLPRGGWGAVFASLLLASAGVHTPGPEALPWLLLAGLLMCVVNFWVGSGVYPPLYLGQPVPRVPRSFFTMLPTALVMVVLAALTVLLVPVLGVAALAVFALIAVLPQTALTL